MRIALVTPPQASAGGNTTTAERWAGILRELGHEVDLTHAWTGGGDVMVALHARKSAASIAAFPGPVVVAVTGTDLYVDLPVSAEARRSLRIARRIVVLNRLATRSLPAELHPRVRVILQSVAPIPATPKAEPWTAAVVAHLRAVKDPLLAGQAAAVLPAASRVRIVHAGADLEPGLADAARALEGPRYRWIGPIPRPDALRLVAAAHLLIVPSRLEGGANVTSEALVHGVPVVASRIDGNLGLLGADWPLVFEPGDAAGLAGCLARWEADPALRADVAVRVDALRADFAPDRERAAWRALLAEGLHAPA